MEKRDKWTASRLLTNNWSGRTVRASGEGLGPFDCGEKADNSPLRRTAQRRCAKACMRDSPLLVGRDDYFKEDIRLKTFEVFWPCWAHAEPGALAAGGLWYIGEGDQVKCFSCAIILDNWQSGEQPLRRHQRTNPDCGFIRNTDQRNIPARYSPAAATDADQFDLPEDLEKLLQENTTISKGTASSQSGGRKNGKSQRKRFGDLRVERNRLKTFDDSSWPCATALARPEDLARAGVYYSGRDGEVVCPYCGTKFDAQRLAGSPVEEHRVKAPNCPFIKSSAEPKRETTDEDMMTSRAIELVRSMGYEDIVVRQAAHNLLHNKDLECSASNLLDEVYSLVDLDKERQERKAHDGQVQDQEKEQEQATRQEHEQEQAAGQEQEREQEQEQQNQQQVPEEYGDDDPTPEEVKLQRVNDDMRSKLVCRLCQEVKASILFLPCRHLPCCSVCAETIQRCPVCHAQIFGTVKTFMS